MVAVGALAVASVVLVVAVAGVHRAAGGHVAVAHPGPSGRRAHGRSPAGGASSGRPGTTAAGRPAARFAVRTTELALVDMTRIAVVDGARGPRRLPTEVWYPVGPAADRPRPLVVFAAGFLQCPDQYAPLLSSWAAAGYVVAAPTFPLTSCDVPGGAEEADILNQPADVAFVARQLVAATAGTLDVPGAAVLRGRIDTAEIAVAGQSDGGDTVAALAANTCCMTLPVEALLVLSGAELSSYGGRYFPPGSPPMLVVQGTADSVNPPAASLSLYQDDEAGPKALVLLDGADHRTPYEGSGPTEEVVSEVTVAFLDRWLGHEPGAAAALARAGDQPGIDSLQTAPGP